MNSDLRLNHSQFQAAKRVVSILREPACPDLNRQCRELGRCLNARRGIVLFTRQSNISTDFSQQTLVFYRTMQTRYENCERRLLSHLTNGRYGEVAAAFKVDSVLVIDDVVMLLMGTVDEIPLPDKYKTMITEENSVVTKRNTIKSTLWFDEGWTAILQQMVSILRFDKNDVMHDLITFLEAGLQTTTCTVCLERERDIVFMPCKMCIVCHICWQAMKDHAKTTRRPIECPMCRASINENQGIALTQWQVEGRGVPFYTGSCMKDVFSLLASLQTHA